LSFVEFRVLESSHTNQTICHSGRQIFLLNINKIAHHQTNSRWQRAYDLPFFPFSGRTPMPWSFAFVSIGQIEMHSDWISLRGYLMNYSGELIGRDSLD